MCPWTSHLMGGKRGGWRLLSSSVPEPAGAAARSTSLQLPSGPCLCLALSPKSESWQPMTEGHPISPRHSDTKRHKPWDTRQSHAHIPVCCFGASEKSHLPPRSCSSHALNPHKGPYAGTTIIPILQITKWRHRAGPFPKLPLPGMRELAPGPTHTASKI